MASPKLLAILALFALLSLHVAPSAMAARSVPVHEPEWPCCDFAEAHPEGVFPCCPKYFPPADTSAEFNPGLDLAPAPGIIHIEAVATEDTAEAEPEWPCCRQYDEPPVADNLN